MTDEDEDFDSFGPPREPCECWCLHCRRTFMSNLMWYQKVIGDPQGDFGFWMCPTHNCGGAGFTFDIFPTDPAHPANEGWHSFCDDDEEEDDELGEVEGGQESDWDPAEEKYAAFDEEYEEAGEDLEGEEWKHGLAPGERLATEESSSQREQRLAWEEEQKRYDAPDERPRERQWQPPPSRPDGVDGDDAIPY